MLRYTNTAYVFAAYIPFTILMFLFTHALFFLIKFMLTLMDELRNKFAQLDSINKQIADVKHKIIQTNSKNRINNIIASNQIHEAVELHKEMQNNFELNNYIIKTIEKMIEEKQHVKLKDIVSHLKDSPLHDKCLSMIYTHICTEFSLETCNFDGFVHCLKSVNSFYGNIFDDMLQKYSVANYQRFMSTSNDTLELDKKIVNLIECMLFGFYLDKIDVYVILEDQYIKKVVEQNYLQTKDDIVYFKERIMKRAELVDNKDVLQKIKNILDSI